MRKLTRLAITAGVCLLAAGCGGSGNQVTTTSASSSATATTTSATPVAQSAIDALLLSPNKIDAATGAEGRQ